MSSDRRVVDWGDLPVGVILSMAELPEHLRTLCERFAAQHHPEMATETIQIRLQMVDGVKALQVLAGWGSASAQAPSPPAAPNLLLPFPPAAIPIVATRSGQWRGTYEEYTSHPEFHRIAAIAKREWGFKCLLNVNHRGPVEMHHRTYAHVPFGEDWRDLIPLCAECHGRHHLRLAKPPIGLFEDDAHKRAA